jgi:hypothetical protein
MNRAQVENEVSRAFDLLDTVRTPPDRLRQAADIIENAVDQASFGGDFAGLRRVVVNLRATATKREVPA